jgi:hypothetical protein
MRAVTSVAVAAIAAAALVAGGCGRGVADVVQAVPEPAPVADPVTEALRPVLVVSGVDATPVAGARVVVGGEELTSDASGLVHPSPAPASQGLPRGAAIDVLASGFLLRQTKVPSSRVVDLWPVSDAAEAQAVRRMVYDRDDQDGEVLLPPESRNLLLIVDTSDPDIVETWRAGAAAFGGRLGLGYRFASSFQYENELQVRFTEAPGCEPVAAWGFCRERSFWKVFSVLPERARDPQTARRVLASWFLGPHPLPGLLNTRAPSDDLSALEEQTIHMILRRPLPNRWPDNDR